MGKVNDIEALIQAINEKYGPEPYNNNDFPPITEGPISQATVARIWKLPEARECVHISTLDILARCVGYESYRGFRQQRRNMRKVHKAVDGTIFTQFYKHQETLNQVIDAFVDAGYLSRGAKSNKLRWVKEPWKRQEFACWITELCYLLNADNEKDYNLIKQGSFCEVSAQTFIASFTDIPSEITDVNLREAVSQYRKQITKIHKNNLSSQYTPDQLYRLSVKTVLENDIDRWYVYDNKGEIKSSHTFKRLIYLPILAIFNNLKEKH